MIKRDDRSVSFFLCQLWIQCLKRGHTYCQELVFENYSSFHRNSLDPFKCNISKTLKWQRKPVFEPSNVMSTMVFLVTALGTFEHNALCQVLRACKLEQKHREKQPISEQCHQTDVRYALRADAGKASTRVNQGPFNTCMIRCSTKRSLSFSLSPWG